MPDRSRRAGVRATAFESRTMSRLSLVATRAPESADLTLDAVRSEIDQLDEELLRLVERRLRLASRIGGLKESRGPGLKLRPDREAAVVRRMLDRAAPASRKLAQALWRELMSAGLAVQTPLEVAVWTGARRDVRERARSRFGACAGYAEHATPEAALAAAERENTIAVLALDPDAPWWAGLPERPDLLVFEALGRRGPIDPSALAVGRVARESLAEGVRYRVSEGGESDAGARPGRLVAAGVGRRLYACRETRAVDAPGFIGTAPMLG
jgi:chorismate mutase